MKRKYTKRDTEYWKRDEGFAEYMKEYSRIQQTIRKSKGKWKQGLFKAGESFEFDVKASKMMGRSKYREYVRSAAGFGKSGIAVAREQFNLLSDDLADKILENLYESGITTFTDSNGNEVAITKDMVMTRQLPQEVWDRMETYANEKGLEMSYFFGS